MKGVVCILVLNISSVCRANSLSDIQIEKWHESQSSLLSAEKEASGEKLLMRVELSVARNTDVIWVVDRTVIGTNEKEFNTSSQKLKTSILYIIEVSTEVESLKLISFSQENVDTWYHLDLKADDSKRYFNIGTCHSLIANINSTAAAASFRCSPELDSRNSWYQEMALITKSSRNEGTSWVNISNNNFTPDINVSLERDKTAKGTVNFSKRFLMIQNSFLFLDSFLTIDLNSIVKTIQYRNTRDISLIKKDGEFVVERVPHSLKPVDGEITTIQCETFGRNPPPIRVERNGMAILDADDVFILSINTNLRTSSSVTFLHNTKEMEGNYTCVLGDEGKDMVPLYVFELKPRVPRDLMQKSILQNEKTNCGRRIKGQDYSLFNSRN